MHAQACVRVAFGERVGNRINNQPHNESNPQRAACTWCPLHHAQACCDWSLWLWLNTQSLTAERKACVCVFRSRLSGEAMARLEQWEGWGLFDVNEAASQLVQSSLWKAEKVPGGREVKVVWDNVFSVSMSYFINMGAVDRFLPDVFSLRLAAKCFLIAQGSRCFWC